MGSRSLTAGEITIAQTVYGTEIDYSDVKIHDEKHNFLQDDNTIVTPNGEIYYSEGLYRDDISQGTNSEKAIFIHELGHVLQEQKGMSIILQRILDGSDYNYDPIFHGTPFDELPMEAQAEFLEDLYRKRNGMQLRPDKGSGGTLEDADRDLSEYEAEVPMLLPNGNPNGDSLDDLAEPYIPLPPIALPQTMADFLDDWGVAKLNNSPLVLDLDGQGIDLASVLGTDAVYWDIDQDGFGEKSGWISGNDGLLAIDLNADGIINDHGELFGTDAIDGFTILSAYDSNTDNVIDVNDAQFSDLLVWVDANSDGYSQSGELFSLTDLGITSINLNASLVDYDIAGNHVTHESTFTINGQTQTIVDAWFAYDNANSHYQESYTLDIRTLYLPTLRGFGDVKDLHITMSMDETLLLIVQEIAVADVDTILFDPAFDLLGKIETIMLRWAGVDGVDPMSRGEVVDAQKLEFLEAYLGDDYVNPNTGATDPTAGGVNNVHDLFDDVVTQIAFSIIAQTDASSYLGNGASYNLATGQVEGVDTVDNLSFVNAASQNSGTENNDAFVFADNSEAVSVYEGTTGGYDQIWVGYDSTDVQSWVDNGGDLHIRLGETSASELTVYGQSNGANGVDMVDRIDTISFADGVVWDLTQGLKNISDTNDAHTLYGSALDDIIDGRGGLDNIYGWGGNDILIGGSGDDYLNGGDGDDTYVYALGDGNDSIGETSGYDVISFGVGIALTDLTFTHSGVRLLINFSDGSTITIPDYFSGNVDNVIEELRFDDGSTENLQILVNTAPTAQDDAFIGDQDISLIGNVLVNNGSGADSDPEGNALSVAVGTYATANGSVVVSANGDFTYTPNAGYNGADSFTYTVDDGFGGSDTATVNITVRPPNVAPVAQDDTFTGDQDINITGNVLSDNGSGSDTDPDSDPLTVVAGTYATTNGSVVITSSGSFTYTPNAGYVGSDIFTYTLQDDRGGSDVGTANITVNALATNPNAINGTSANDNLNGDPSGTSNDTLIGYGGDDTLNGMLGNDNYEWSVGDGNDTINETGGLDQLVLHGVVASDVRLEIYNTYNLRVHVGSEHITLNSQLYEDAFGSPSYDTYQVENILLDDGSTIDLVNNITFTGTSGNDTINGLNAATTFIGKAGDDTLNGKVNDDTYVWSVGDGNDTIAETGGVDQLVLHGVVASDIRFEVYNTYNLRVHIGSEHITLNSQLYEDAFGSPSYDIYQVENILLDDGSTIDLLNNLTFAGTAGNDTINGMNADDVLLGLAGNDTLNANSGNDTITGGAGDDILNGGAGNDDYVWSVGDGNDTIAEANGVDQLVLHGVVASDIRFEIYNTYNLRVHIGSEHITLNSQLYEDVFGSPSYDIYQVENILLDDGSTINLLNNLTFAGTAGNDTINGMNADDMLLGLAGNDILNAQSGNDTLTGGAGDDVLNGGAGNDNYVWSVGDGNDTIAEAGGVDQLVLHGAIASDIRFEIYNTYNLRVHVGSEHITLNSQFYEDAFGSPSYDIYQVESILLDDGSTIDLLNNLTFTGTASNETMNGLNADDILFGLDGADTLNGGNGNDVLHGGGGSDYLYGNAGDDVLYGGAGVDMVYGQAGADTFVFESSTAFAASDNIQDFNLSDGDKLDVSDLLIGYDPLTDAISDFVQITESGSNSYLSVDADGGADNFVQVAYLYNATGLTDEDALETSGNLIAA